MPILYAYFGKISLGYWVWILRHSVKPDDLIGRYGGDEFVVLVKQVRNLKVLEGITQKILSAIAALDYHEPDAIKLTCSIGAAFAPQDGTDLNRLIYVADQRLYCAKHRGKNMAILEDTPAPDTANEPSGADADLVTRA